MTGSTLEAIAKRAVACKHWRWMPGMLARYDQLSGAWHRCPKRLRDVPKYLALDPEAAWPDLTDPATLGCLLALVRDAWDGTYTVCGESQLSPAALVAALEGRNDSD